MPSAPVVVGVNYHRIGATDPANPYHRLHTVPGPVFGAQLAWMMRRGRLVSPDQVRAADHLAPVNFVVCFDDISTTALPHIRAMLDGALPVTLSPAGLLTEHGNGHRDRVYAIEALTPPDVIAAHLRTVLPARADEPFYRLTKSCDLDPTWVRHHLVDPLYAQIQHLADPLLAKRGYLSWDQLRPLATDPMVTLANHTWSHDNLEALTSQQRHHEILEGDAALRQGLGLAPHYLTLPFGRFDQHVALDALNGAAGELGYRGLLWVTEAGLSVPGPYRAQTLHLPRVHAATTLGHFQEQVQAAIRDATTALAWQIPARRHNHPVTVTARTDDHRVLTAETIIRQGKDYASDPAFYDYQFTSNPYRGDRPDYYTVDHDGHTEATAYNFHALFQLGPTLVPGVYLSSWRTMPLAHRSAAGQLLNAMLEREPVVGAWNPNPAIHSAFRGWARAQVTELLITPGPPPPGGGTTWIEESDYPSAADELCAQTTTQAGFTVHRDATYHRWRHVTYPLAACTFLRQPGQPDSLVVLHHVGERAAVSDWYCRNRADLPELLTAVHDWAARSRVTRLTWQTSDPHLATLASSQVAAQQTSFTNFYRFNTALLPKEARALLDHWTDLPLHETGTTSDVLLR